MRRLLSTCLALAVLSSPSLARATDVQACIAASERGQRLRAAGKLREARDQFQVCGSESCPALIRKDCAQWQTDVSATLPTVVFGAKDRRGRDLLDVTVSMDGDVLVKRLDGKAVAVDPGPHTFRFDATGAPPITERVLVKEGERARSIDVVIADATEHGVDGTKATPAARTAETSGEPHGHSAVPWILGGVGLATIVFGVVWTATAPTYPDGCRKETKTCTRVAGESDADYKDRQSRASRAEGQPKEGALILGIGGALLATGIVWYLVEPTGPRTSRPSALRASPWTTADGAGVSFTGAF